MPLKDAADKNFTGFVAHYSNGRTVFEKENYFSKKLSKKCATNWAEIDKEKLVRLELMWKGKIKAAISRTPDGDPHRSKEIGSGDWFFSQKGYFDLATHKVVVISRNIGYVDGNIAHITSVVEETGVVQFYTRAI